MRLLRKTLLITALAATIIAASALWIVATQPGTRWLIHRLADRFPEQASVGAVQGTLVHGVTVDSLSWRSDDLQLAADGVELDFELLPLATRHLIVNRFRVGALRVQMSDTPAAADGGGGDFSVDLPLKISLRQSWVTNIDFQRGSLQRSIARLEVAGDIEGERLRVDRLVVRSDWLDLDLAGSGALADDYALEAEAKWRWKEQEALPLGGRLQASGNLREYRIEHALEAPQSVSTTGTISFADETLSVDLLNRWASLRWPLAERELRASGGSLQVTGRLDNFEIELVSGVGLDGGDEAQVRLAGRGEWQPAPKLDLDYRIAGLDPSLLRSELQGSLASDGTIVLVVDEGTPDVTLGIRRIAGQLNGYSVEGRAVAHYAHRRTTITDASLRLGDNSVTGSGSFGDGLAVDAQLDLADLSQIVADAGGRLGGRIAVSGTLARPEVAMNLRGADVSWQDYGVAALRADASFRGDEVGRAEVTIEGASSAALQVDSIRLELDGRPGDHNLRTSLQAYGNRLEIVGKGRYAQPSWALDLERVEIANSAMGTWSSGAPSRLEIAPGVGQLQQTCLVPAADGGRACVTAGYDSAGTSAELTIAGLPLAALPVRLPSGISVKGSLDARLQAEATADDLTASAEVQLQDASVEALYEGERIALVLTEARGAASLIDRRIESSAQVVLADDAGAASARLTILDAGNSQYPVDGLGTVTIADASFLAAFVPGIEKPRGRIGGELTVSGLATAPEFVGAITLEDGAFRVRQTGIEVFDANLRIAQSQPGQMQLRGSARSGDGELTIEGTTRVSQEAGVRSELWLQGQNFELARLPDWQISASPSIIAVFDNRITTIVGELAIPSAKVTIKDIPAAAQKTSPDAVVHRQDSDEPTRLRRIDLHLRTSLGDDVEFTGFGLSTGLEGALQMRGGTHAPYTGTGRLSLVNGRYKAYGQELEIERGNLVFAGPLDEPLLDIRAVRRVGDVDAGIQLTGRPSRLQSDLFSVPPMSDAETLSYLLTGRPLSNAMNSGEGDTLNQAAFALGLSGAGLITSQIRSQLGLETLTIEGSKDESRLVAGKRLGNRLVVEYGYGLVDKLGTLLLRYQLNDRFMLESRTGTVSNLDLLYRARKR